jgi:hypothetical protein
MFKVVLKDQEIGFGKCALPWSIFPSFSEEE